MPGHPRNSTGCQATRRQSMNRVEQGSLLYVETLVQHLTVGDFLIGIIHIFVRPSLPAVFGERHAQITAVGFAQGLNSFPNAR